jgi:hypothetical protein
MAARWPHGGNGDCASARAGYGWRRRGDLLRRSISSARARRPPAPTRLQPPGSCLKPLLCCETQHEYETLFGATS